MLHSVATEEQALSFIEYDYTTFYQSQRSSGTTYYPYNIPLLTS